MINFYCSLYYGIELGSYENNPGWNAHQGVENVHTLCAGKPEFDDGGNNMIAGPSGRTV